MMPPPSLRGVREFELPGPGRLVQGGADAVRCFYKEPGTIIVNCARAALALRAWKCEERWISIGCL